MIAANRLRPLKPWTIYAAVGVPLMNVNERHFKTPTAVAGGAQLRRIDVVTGPKSPAAKLQAQIGNQRIAKTVPTACIKVDRFVFRIVVQVKTYGSTNDCFAGTRLILVQHRCVNRRGAIGQRPIHAAVQGKAGIQIEIGALERFLRTIDVVNGSAGVIADVSFKHPAEQQAGVDVEIIDV